MSYATRWTRRPVGKQYLVVPRKLATADLRDAAVHYATEADTVTARQFIDAVEQAFTLLARQPGIGSPRYAVDLDWPGLRTHPVQPFPYLIFIFYLDQTDHLDVLRVLHAHRDIPTNLQDAETDT
jgi:toxin ParE1/3/4